MSDKTIKDYPSVKITISAYNTRATKASGNEGIMTLVFDPTFVYSDEAHQVKLGSVAGGIGCVVISTEKGYYMIDHHDLWNAIAEQESRDEQDSAPKS